VVLPVTKRPDTILITCTLDGHAHDVTGDNLTAGQRNGHYQALCGHIVSAAALAAPIGRPCANCTTILAAHQAALTTGPTRRSRHRKPGWLQQMLRPHNTTSTDARTRQRS
jgi:hypothetical protein